MRKDSELFLRKLLEYREQTGKDSFEVNYHEYKEIPNIKTAIFDILEDLIKNNCLTSQSKVTDFEGHTSISLTLDGIVYFEETEKKNTSEYIFNVHDGQVNFVKDNGTVNALQNNINKRNDSNNVNSKKFLNNKKQKYIENWNSRLFLHLDNDERPITLADAFIMPDYEIYKSISRIGFSNDDKLDVIIDKFIKYDRTSIMLITGVPGIGKSSITSWIANKYKDDDRVIILRFRDWKRIVLEKSLLSAICHMLDCEESDLENKILVLDGFDEMKALDIRERFLYGFNDDIKDFENFKVIITSRPTYINHEYFNNVLNLEEFDIEKVDVFVRKITDKVLKDKEKIESNLEVLGIPVILYMAVMSGIDISENPTKPGLYNRIFSEKGGIFDKFCIDGVGYGEGSQIMRNHENIKEYLNFLRRIAFEMFEKNELLLHKFEYQIPKLEFQQNKISILEFPIKHLFENTDFNIEFIHKSVYEYFVSEYIFIVVCEGLKKQRDEFASDLGNMLKSNILSDEILEFLKFKVHNTELIDKFSFIIDTFELMLQDGMTYYTNIVYKNVIECELKVFVNMLEFIHLWKFLCLKLNYKINKYIKYSQYLKLNLSFLDLNGAALNGADLGGANLSGADLMMSDLGGANLSRANLSRANLYEANLSRANLSRANLNEANLNEANLSRANLSRANLNEADLNYSFWNKDSIDKVTQQLKYAHFEDIVVVINNKQIRVTRDELFANKK